MLEIIILGYLAPRNIKSCDTGGVCTSKHSMQCTQRYKLNSEAALYIQTFLHFAAFVLHGRVLAGKILCILTED